MIAAYFRAETGRLAGACLADIRTLEDWTSRREEYRRQLFEMLSLDPLPERTDLQPVVTGRVEHDEFTVENLHFQSLPGLYVTGNLYLPKGLDGPAPAILYLCGHGRVAHNGVSHGNKVHYQHHPAWYARHGYVALAIDTIQLGEIEGLHHGTYRQGMWWWNSRGYTPAGVEAWNAIRSLDYLESRPEVDPARLGATGRSGGGAYTWWVAALDDRVKVAVPVAGITDLENHVVDGCVEGHCDCMFLVNTYGWDYAQVAALVAPRPLLISNSDKDRIFPLDGVGRIHRQVRRIYDLYGAGEQLGLHITEGPHKDTQELQIHAFVWFDRFLKGDARLIERPAVPFFAPPELKVFESLPPDERNTSIHESFVPLADVGAPPDSPAEWAAQRDAWYAALEEKVFAGWPRDAGSLDLRPVGDAVAEGLRLRTYELTSQAPLRLPLLVLQGAQVDRPELLVLNVLDEEGWQQLLAQLHVAFEGDVVGEPMLPPAAPETFAPLKSMLTNRPWAMAYVAPRGIGPTAWTAEKLPATHIRRRFALLGQTLDGMRTWDVRRAIQAVRALEAWRDVPLWLEAKGPLAGVALYASLFEPDVVRLDLWQLPSSHREGPELLNVLRYLDLPQAVALAAERSRVRLYDATPDDWAYAVETAESQGWGSDRVQLRSSANQDGASDATDAAEAGGR